MTDAIMANYAQQLAPPGTLVVKWVGDGRSQAAAARLEAYLTENGFHIVDEGGVSAVIPSLDGPVKLIQGVLYIDASK